ncbi:MAG: transporter substrate-binding domain-containing protein [Alphaproteobacteria bacterium]|nr:transporter substrate-binding domain-containing protein [Alphaproteobacteria bacterium]
MPRGIIAKLVALVLFGSIGAEGVHARALELAVPPNHPVAVLEGGRLSGVLAEVADTALRQAGFQPSYVAMPFGRIYPLLAARQIDGALSVFGTPERQRTAWYSTPIVTEYSVLIVPKGRSFPFSRAADAAGKVIGTQTGFAYPGFDGTPGVIFQPTPERANNLRLVALGRVDAAITGSITGLFQARELDLMDRIDVLPVAVSAITLSIALNNERFSEADMARVNEALGQLLASRQFEAASAAAGVDGLIRRFELLEQP